MVAPVLEREGARIGGVTKTSVAVSCRTNSDGVNLYLSIFDDSEMTVLVDKSPAAALNFGNNYTNTAYVDSLAPNKEYWWVVSADDGAGNETFGDGAIYQGNFRTLKTDGNYNFGWCGCWNNVAAGSSLLDARITRDVVEQIISLDLDHIYHIGDLGYTDSYSERNSGNTINYAPNALADWPTDQTITQQQRTERGRTAYYTFFDSVEYQIPGGASMAHLFANTPIISIFDDHDRGAGNSFSVPLMTGSPWKQDAVRGMHYATHEVLGDLSRRYLEDSQSGGYDFVLDTLDEEDLPIEYFYVDYPNMRMVILDGRTFRDPQGKTDDSLKTMLGAVQKQWLKDVISNNPYKFLIIGSGLMGDGDHDWDPELAANAYDTWKGYSTEWNEILEHIWDNGDAKNTLFLSADTHVSAVVKYEGEYSNRIPIYEISSSNMWTRRDGGNHDYVSGFSSELRGTLMSPSAVGYGGRCDYMQTISNSYIVLEGNEENITVSIYKANNLPETSYSGKPSKELTYRRTW